MKKYIPTIVGWIVGAATLLVSYLVPQRDDMVLCYGVETAALIMAIAAAAVTTGVAIRNSIAAKKSKAAADRTIGGLNAENASNYYSDYYRGALENDSTRAYLKRLDAAMARQSRALDNSIVATGATNENKLAAKQAKNEVTSNAMAQAVQAEDARKERIRNNYMTRKQGLTLQQMQNDQNYEAQKSANLSQIASGISQAASAYGMYAGGGFGSTAGAMKSGAATQSAAQSQLGGQMRSQALNNNYNTMKTAATGYTGGTPSKGSVALSSPEKVSQTRPTYGFSNTYRGGNTPKGPSNSLMTEEELWRQRNNGIYKV